ncbi:MAG: patatin-like phospholipase family protein [Kofleriaceae bacterium]
MAVPPRVAPLRVAVVLAGAVAKGAFEAGVLQALARTSVDIVRVVAASSGALNGTLLASAVRTRSVPQGVDLLAELWRNNAGWTDVVHANFSDITQRRSVSDSKRVLELLRERIPPVDRADVEPINLRLLVAPLNGVAGTIGDHPASTFESVRDFESPDFATAASLERVFAAATASSAFPFLFAPVEIDDIGPCVDGGAVNNTPVKWALEGTLGASLDAIVVVSTMVELRTAPAAALHGLAYAGHLATMLIGERLYRDLHEAEQVNAQLANLMSLVDAGVIDGAQLASVLNALDWSGRRPVTIMQIRPEAELPGTSFSGFAEPAQRRAYLAAGLARGLAVLQHAGWI